MEAQLSTIEAQVKSIKEMMFSEDTDPQSLLAPSAYDTAWLAMIPDSHEPLKPMFNVCLNWVLNNQNESGFWGDHDGRGNPNMECLASTLACIVALRRWNVGSELVNKGLDYIHSPEADKLLKESQDCYSLWFAIVFPGMVEIAFEVADLCIELELSDIFYRRKQILEMEGLVNKYHYTPLMSYLEALPSWYSIDGDKINYYVDGNGSFFQSPSATARAFMATGNPKCLFYLKSLVQRFSDKGVPKTYPVDEGLIKLSAINHVERLGLSEYFMLEKEIVLEEAYKNYTTNMNRSQGLTETLNSVASIEQKILKDSLAFRLLRMHGYEMLPWHVCWFLYDEKVKDLIENNYEYFSWAMLNVYRATDIMFSTEFELQEAREFSSKLIQKSILVGGARGGNLFHRLIEHELRLPWMARLDHLEHRLWIEENEANNALWMGKTSLQRFSRLYNDKLVELAMLNYQFKQFIFKNELEELKRWSKDRGLTDIGFGREKTAYCYFAVAASSSFLPYDSDVRMISAKSGIVITVADDFFDMKCSDLDELRSLTNAVGRWDGKCLCGDSKIIFDALDNLVTEMATKYAKHEQGDITGYLRDIWYETFCSWLTESEWGRTERKPSIEEYLGVGMISIAIHTIVLPASCFLSSRLPQNYKLRPVQYEKITILIMIISRLLNDIQSYKKEQDEGTVNSVLLYLENNPEVDMEEAIASVRDILNKKKEELLEHVFRDGLSADLPREYRLLHLSSVKVFQMFFDSSNRYDSDTEVLDDIAKAIYVPLKVGEVVAKPVRSLPSGSHVVKCSVMKHSREFRRPATFFTNRSFHIHKISKQSTTPRVGNWKMFNMGQKFMNFRFA